MPIKYDEKGAVKRPGQKLNFTKEQFIEVQKCAMDIEYFAEKYFKIITKTGKHIIKLRDYQKRMLKEFDNNRFVITLCGRQMGKTTTVDIYVLHYALFNANKFIAVLANKAEMAKSILSEIKQAYENLPNFLKLGVKEYNAFSVEFENDTKIVARATSEDAIRGETPNLVVLDEFAFVPENISDAFYTSNYPALTASEGKMVIISTPKGTSNLFYRLWKDSIDKKNNFIPIKVEWWEDESRNEKWKAEVIKDIGLIRFNQEYACQFQGSAITLINSNFIVQSLKWTEPIKTIDDMLKIWVYPIQGHKYVCCIDTAGGVGSDSSIINIFDITFYPEQPAVQVATYKNNMIAPPAFAQFVFETATDWYNAYIIGELNGLSAEVFNRLFDMEYENLFYDYEDDTYGMYADKVSKPKSAIWFKDELEAGRIKINDTETIDEIGYFEEVKPGVYKAKEGRNNHDDLVMTCLWLAYFLKSPFFEDERSTWSEIIENSIETEDPESEAAFNAFLAADEEVNGEDWLFNDEFNN